jgi:membrane protease subunit (stomatin/prohibitin family)
MGLIRATVGAIGGTLADQWKDFLTVPTNIWPTAALFPAVTNGINAERGSNFKGSEAVISNGSKIVVPEGYGLIVLQDGALTGFTGESGAYIWDSSDLNSQSLFAGNGVHKSLISQSWDRFKSGGRPAGQQLALFIRLQELPNNKFGTQSEVYWDDAYLNAQVGAITHGTYSLTITDPIKFVMSFVPATYLQGLAAFDFTDMENANANQLLNEVVGSLAAAFSAYANASDKGNRISQIQQDSVAFAASLAQAVETGYSWAETRGLSISKAAILGIQYDADTKELLKTVQRADALQGNRGNANLQASVAQGIQSAGETGGADGILGIGFAAGSIGVGGLMQNAQQAAPAQGAASEPDLVETLEKLKRALDAGLIDQADYDAAKAKALGL